MASSGRKILRRFSSSISDLLSIQRKNAALDENYNYSPLHTAVRMGNSVMTKNILDCRMADVDAEDSHGRTALHHAMEQNITELASMLLVAKANPDSVDYTGLTPTHLACMHGMIDLFNLLMYYKADACVVDKSGKTPFDLACEHGKLKMAERILDCGIAQSVLRNAGETHTASALHLAARMGHVQIVSLLVESNWPLNRVTARGSALHEAAAFGRTQVVRFLLHAGIDVSITNSAGQTALEFAKKNSQRNPITYKEIRFLLKEYKNFVYGEAIEEHVGVKADELSFSKGDIIWIIERGTTEDVRYRGVIFGQKANSRSGLFDQRTVRIIDRPVSVVSMSNRLSGMPTVNGPRQLKKVDVPTVPGMAPIQLARPDNMLSGSRFLPSRLSDERSSNESNTHRTRHQSPALSTFGGYREMSTFVANNNNHMQTRMHGMSTSSPSAAATTNGAAVCSPRNSTGSNSSQGSSGFESMKSTPNTTSASSSNNSFRTAATVQIESPASRISLNSNASGGSGPSSQSSCSVDTLDDSGYGGVDRSVNVTQMVQKGVPEAEILALWLDKLGFSEYLSLFLTQGYDLSSIARITPEDLLSLGITNPAHRIKLVQEIHTWHITDTWPSYPPPGGLREWLLSLALPEYIGVFESQNYNTVQEVMKLNWEDFEDIGVKRLGHLKRLGLAIKKLKDGRRNAPPPSSSSHGSTHEAHAQHPSQQQMHHQNGNMNPVPIASPVPSARSVHDPPPPAPTSVLKKKAALGQNIDYLSYQRGSNNAVPPPPPVRSDEHHSIRKGYEDLFERREPIRLNLVNTSRILSDAESINWYGTSHSYDCPPPPAPISCDKTIRRMRETAAMGNGFSSSPNSSNNSYDHPFANENCGTIRPRHNSASRDALSPPRLPALFQPDSRPEEDALDAEAKDVLGDLGSMLQNLMQDLDMVTSKPSSGSSVKTMTTSSFPVAQ